MTNKTKQYYKLREANHKLSKLAKIIKKRYSKVIKALAKS